MKYSDITIYAQHGTTVYKDAKEVHMIEYPRLNEADSYLQHLKPSKVMCTLLIPDESHYFALKQLDRTHSEETLYVDKFGVDKHYYKRVTLELGEAKPGGVLSDGKRLILASAVFTCLDPYLYDATTDEVVY